MSWAVDDLGNPVTAISNILRALYLHKEGLTSPGVYSLLLKNNFHTTMNTVSSQLSQMANPPDNRTWLAPLVRIIDAECEHCGSGRKRYVLTQLGKREYNERFGLAMA